VPRKKKLFVVCAVDADVEAQIRSGRPRWNRAKWDASVVDALRRLCTRVEVIGVKHGDLSALAQYASSDAVIFNLALSATPLESMFAACVQYAGLRCTGSGMIALALANDKIRSRMLLAAAGIRVPRFVVLAPDANPGEIDLTPPIIVKPAWQGSAWGISRDSVVMTREDVLDRARRIWERFEEPAVADEFIRGRELRAGMVEGPKKRFQIAGIGEWSFQQAGDGFRMEGSHKNQRVHIMRRSQLPAALRADIIALAQKAFDTIGIRGYASLDLRLDELGRLTVLEVNANPGISSDSPVWSASGFDRIVQMIVEAALRG
jgi:D-alanine-D-alanine ligase